jgi:Mrp family chromosome partitioning ATPase
VPFAPRPKRDAAFAFAIALGLGLALTLALERFDRRITKLEEVDDAYGVPLLAVIPHTATPVNLQEGAAAVPLALREPFRSLRTNLQLAGLEKPIRLVAVASAIAGEGKSTVVTNLALTYREFGLRVVIVEADLRRPSLGASWGINSLPGLTGVLAGACELDEALVEVEVDAPDVELVGRLRGEAEPPEPRTPAATAAGPAKLALLPSGPTPPNPQAVLGADSMFQVLDELAERFDVVLIDTPPLLAVSDAIPLLSHCDGVILVTRVGVTERPAAARAVAAARLDPVVRLLGVVANDVARQPGSSYSYGYGYGYGYGRG